MSDSEVNAGNCYRNTRRVVEKDRKQTVLILGAGFSKNVGLPLQKELSRLLVCDVFEDTYGHMNSEEKYVDDRVRELIKEFLRNVFGWDESKPLPDLEDFFTCIDLAANNGHYLGKKYSPAKLRAIRRLAIYRILRLLNKLHKTDKQIKQLLRIYSPSTTGFVVLNWDIVLENHLAHVNGENAIDYCCECANWDIINNTQPTTNNIRRVARVAKMHGSANWVYCDNCKMLYYKLSRKLPLDVKADLRLNDFKTLKHELGNDRRLEEALGDWCIEKCSCGTQLSSHLATFSFRKSFRTHAYTSVWHAAEKMLAEAERWVFIGYSLPPADYEFRYMLKAAELRYALSNEPTKHIDVVVKDDYDAITRYKTFFGQAKLTGYNCGLEVYVDNLKKQMNVNKEAISK